MSYLGDYFVGDRVHIEFTAYSEYDPNKYGTFFRTAAYTDALPTVTIRGGSNYDTEYVSAESMVRDPHNVGHYWYDFVPTATGQHTAIISYYLGGGGRYEQQNFNVSADPSSTSGGSYGSGRIIALYHYARPEATHILWETRNGDLVARQNPK